MKPLKQIKLSIFLILACLSFSCDNGADTICVKNWKILYEQDRSFDAITQKLGWKRINIPSTFKLPYPPAGVFQSAWLKGEFNIDKNPSVYYGISMGRVYHTAGIFVNNSTIGTQNLEELNILRFPEYYIIPDGILKQGKNEVFIRLGVYGDEYGGLLSNVKIQSRNIFHQSQSLDNFVYKSIPFGFVFLFIGIIVLLIMIFFIFTKEMKLIYFSLGLLFYIILLLFIFLPFKPVNYELITLIKTVVLSAGVPIFTIVLILLIQSLYEVFLSEYNRIIVSSFLIIAAINVLNGVLKYDYQAGLILGWISLIIGILYFSFLIYRLNLLKPDKFRLYMIVFLVALSELIMISEIVSYHAGMHNEDILAMYIVPVIIIIGVILYTRETVKRLMELDGLYDKLKILNEDVKSPGGDKPQITDISEEKLERVIDFIKKNYVSDISREGLAAAVDINPNYMGTLFKAYTGKKINDYINHLRIEDAVKKLEEKNARVIDVAFAVGYESLATFNRVFKKVTGKTPSEYRNEKS